MADAWSIVYGTPLSVLQNNATSSVPGTAVYNPTNGMVLNAGTNTLSVVYTPTDTNYAATNLSVELVVTPAPLSVTASNVLRVYGQANPVFGGTISGVQNGDNIAATYADQHDDQQRGGQLSDCAGVVGSEQAFGELCGDDQQRHVNVSPAILGITANDTNRLYNTANPDFTLTASGFVNGETAEVLAERLALTTVSGDGQPGGNLCNRGDERNTNGDELHIQLHERAVDSQSGDAIGDVVRADEHRVWDAAGARTRMTRHRRLPGTFDYNPTNGMVLPAGTNT